MSGEDYIRTARAKGMTERRRTCDQASLPITTPFRVPVPRARRRPGEWDHVRALHSDNARPGTGSLRRGAHLLARLKRAGVRETGTVNRATVPLPAGFRVAFDPGTQFVGSDVLFGGSPPRLLRLNKAGVRALEELRDGPVGSPDSGRLARRLTDTGLAHPRPPEPERPAEVTVVIPVRDRAASLTAA